MVKRFTLSQAIYALSLLQFQLLYIVYLTVMIEVSIVKEVADGYNIELETEILSRHT